VLVVAERSWEPRMPQGWYPEMGRAGRVREGWRRAQMAAGWHWAQMVEGWRRAQMARGYPPDLKVGRSQEQSCLERLALRWEERQREAALGCHCQE
jgi:hypothetical protein